MKSYRGNDLTGIVSRILNGDSSYLEKDVGSIINEQYYTGWKLYHLLYLSDFMILLGARFAFAKNISLNTLSLQNIFTLEYLCNDYDMTSN